MEKVPETGSHVVVMTMGLGFSRKGGNGMLILTRRVGETLMIGDGVEVTVLGVKGGQVRIGVQAPREIAVHREELVKRMRSEAQDVPGAAQAV